MGENITYPLPIAVFGVLQLACAVAYFILSRALVYHHGPESEIAQAFGAPKKEMLSLAIYVVAVPLAFLDSRIAIACYFIVAAMWIVRDRRVEKRIGSSGKS